MVLIGLVCLIGVTLCILGIQWFECMSFSTPSSDTMIDKIISSPKFKEIVKDVVKEKYGAK